jgi:sigma-B regulation protein RsbU (phosphoserine phosphatase)
VTDVGATAEVSSEAAIDAFYGALLDDDPVALYERAPCGYLSTLPDGTIVKVNSTFLTLSGYQREQLVGRLRFAELLTAGGRIYHETHYAPMLEMQGSARAIALDIVRADGARLPVLVNAVMERDGEGRSIVVRAAVFDATDRREYERELLRAKERAEASEQRSSELARTLQRTLIPPDAPEIPGLDVAAVYRPAGDGAEVGGDFYDIFQIGDGDWVVAIGDVQGKGAEAAVVTALARHTIRAAAVTHGSPADILATLNAVLVRDDIERFCTVVLVRLRRQHDDGWAATLCCAGHPAPLLLSAGVLVDAPPIGAAGSLLGVLDAPTLSDSRHVLAAGDTLLLYTDGVTEARHEGEFYGEERLQATVVAASAPSAASSAFADGLLRSVLQFQHDDPRDDIAVVVVTVPSG